MGIEGDLWQKVYKHTFYLKNNYVVYSKMGKIVAIVYMKRAATLFEMTFCYVLSSWWCVGWEWWSIWNAKLNSFA